ncbi:hypothetical protein HK105_207753 [Polyrhizophydium stewartii]|uniref:Rho-GAP domain-containing protein n=1 Tax=Polyrhizophydium stewartii TaxID=2732419 RepID=A0ABR4MZQ9_9FUNG
MPIFADFRFSLVQAAAVDLNDPSSIAQSKAGFVLKVATTKDNEIRFEAAAVDVLHALLVEVKALMAIAKNKGYLAGGPTHEWRRFYERMMLEASAATDRGRINSAASNPFINFDSGVSSNTLKMIKDAWAAKELRARELQFSDFSKIKLFVGTWNVKGNPVSESLTPWLSTSKEDEPDMYIIGFQEVDLRTEAYIIGNTAKEDEWCKAIETALAASQSEKYIKIAAKQLIGMLMVVYLRRPLYPFVHDVASESVGTGIFSMMGNKGAVGIRLKLFDSYLCFVNAHLAADVVMVDRRNQDYQEICRRMSFPLQSHYKDYMAYVQANAWVASSIDSASALNGFPTPGFHADTFTSAVPNKTNLSTFDADHFIWLGDLNYRVTVSDVEAKKCLSDNSIQDLLKFDQLRIEQAASRSFNGFSEGPITFPPTYKYEPGTSEYVSSEKKRAPSWCDRILWFTNPLKAEDPEWLTLTRYEAVNEMISSDHKPVRAMFVLKIRKLNNDKLSAAQDAITRELDKFENEAQPDLVPDANLIQFGDIRFMVPTTRTIEVENKGQVIAQYRFVSPLEDRICKPWCYITPSTGALMPGEKLAINITILVDRTTVTYLNAGNDSIEDILTLHTENGKDHFISISGRWLPSCFGNPIEVLCRLGRPIRSFALDELCALYTQVQRSQLRLPPTRASGAESESAGPAATSSIESPSPTPPKPFENRLSIPRELWRIIDFIYKFGMDVDNLFLSTGDPVLTEYFRECLDTGVEFDLSVLLSDPVEEAPEAESNDSLAEQQKHQQQDTPSKTPDAASPPDAGVGEGDAAGAGAEEAEAEAEQALDIDEVISNLSKTSFGMQQPETVVVPPPRPRGRVAAVHSAADTLLRFLEALPEPVVPSFMHRRCVLEGYHTFAAARQIVQAMPTEHLNSFVYITSFLREVLANYRGRGGIDEEKFARVFAPILLQTVSADDVPRGLPGAPGSVTGTAPNGGAGSAVGAPMPFASSGSQAGGGGGAAARAAMLASSPTPSSSAAGGTGGATSPPKSTSSYITNMLYNVVTWTAPGVAGVAGGGGIGAAGPAGASVGGALQGAAGSSSGLGILGASPAGTAQGVAVQQLRANPGLIGPPIPAEATSAGGIEAWNRKRWMFLMHFLERENYF